MESVSGSGFEWQGEKMRANSVQNCRNGGGSRVVTDSSRQASGTNSSSRSELYVDLSKNIESGDFGYSDEEERLVEGDDEEEEDGVHGGRMKPLASFDVNRPDRHGRKFGFRDSPATVDCLPSKVAAAIIKPPRRSRDKVGSSSAPRIRVMNECKENGVLVPLCPGKTHIRGMKPKITSPKGVDHPGTSRTFGKKRSRLKTTGGVELSGDGMMGSTERAVEHQQQRGGMDLLLMVLDSGLVEAEGQDNLSDPSLLQTGPDENRLHYSSTEEIQESHRLLKNPSYNDLIMPYIPKSAETAKDMNKDVEPEEEDSEDTDIDDRVISSVRQGTRLRTLSGSPIQADSDEDSDCHEDLNPRTHVREPTSQSATVPKIKDIDRDHQEEGSILDDGEWSNFSVELVTVEPKVALGGPSLDKVIQEHHLRTDSFEYANSINQYHEEDDEHKEHRHAGRWKETAVAANRGVYNEQFPTQTQDSRPRFTQPVKIVGIVDRYLPVEVDVASDVPQGFRPSNQECVSLQTLSAGSHGMPKRRRTAEHVSAFRAVTKHVRVSTSAEVPEDLRHPAMKVFSYVDSPLPRNEDHMHNQKSDTSVYDHGVDGVREMQPTMESVSECAFQIVGREVSGSHIIPDQNGSSLSWWEAREDPSAQGQGGRNHILISESGIGLDIRSDPDLQAQFPQTRSQFGQKQGGNVNSTGMCMGDAGQDSCKSVQSCEKADVGSAGLPVFTDEVTVAHFQRHGEALPDLVRVVTSAHSRRELCSTTNSHTLQPTAEPSQFKQVEPVICNRTDGVDLKTTIPAPLAKRRRRNIPLVASHFQDSHQSKTILSKPWFEPSELAAQGTVQPPANVNTDSGSFRSCVEKKVRRRRGPKTFQPSLLSVKVQGHAGHISNCSTTFSSHESTEEIQGSNDIHSSICRRFPQGQAEVQTTRRRRGYKKVQQESLKFKRGMNMTGKFKRLSEPSGFLGDFNPGIMQRVRNTKQIHAVLGALVGEAALKVATTISSRPISLLEVPEMSNEKAEDLSHAGTVSGDSMPCPNSDEIRLQLQEHKSTILLKNAFSREKIEGKPVIMASAQSFKDAKSCQELETVPQGEIPDEEPHETGKSMCGRQPGELEALQYPVAEVSQPSNSIECGDTELTTTMYDGEMNHLRSCNWNNPRRDYNNIQDHKSEEQISDHKAGSFCITPVTSSTAAAGFAAQWLGLLNLDIKGRLSALKRSRRRVRALLVSGELDNAHLPTPDFSSVDHGGAGQSQGLETNRVTLDPIDFISWAKQEKLGSQVDKWRALFTNMDGVLCVEAAKLESNLWQIQQMEVLCQEPKHLVSAPLPPTVACNSVPEYSNGKENCPPQRWPFSRETMERELALAASAASIMSTAAIVTKAHSFR